MKYTMTVIDSEEKFTESLGLILNGLSRHLPMLVTEAITSIGKQSVVFNAFC